jgi:alpha-galactosidase
VRIDGVWSGAGADGACTVLGAGVSCPATNGSVRLERSDVSGGATLRVCFTADAATRVEGLEAMGAASIPGARSWLSNGFQSWSQTGMIAIGDPPDAGGLARGLSARGDPEVLRTGDTHSWEHTVIGGGDGALLVAALAADVWKPWASVHRGEGELLLLRAVSGGSGESAPVAAGEELCGEPFFVAAGTDHEALLAAHAAMLPARAAGATAEAGWNSWYELWDTVDEVAIRENAALAREILAPRLPPGAPLRIVVDDGWQVMWGEWTPNAKFPSGLDGLATDLRADGFEMGVWLAPLLVDDDSALVADHPEWFVADAMYNHAKNGPMRILDVTHPEAALHLAAAIAQIVSWGYSLLKIDFLFAGTYEGGRAEDVTGMQAYHRALEIIREAAGEDTILLAVGSPGLATLPHVDAWRVGGDIALEPFGVSWSFVVNQARSIAGRVPLCQATLCDADPVILRELPEEEVASGAYVVALAGGALFLSDDLRALPMERRAWGLDEARVSAALSGAPSMPEDFFPATPPATLPSAIEDHLARGGATTHVLPRIWRLPDGSRIALNETDEAITIEGTEIPPRAVRGL